MLIKLALAMRHQLRRKAAERGVSAVQAQVLVYLDREGPTDLGSLAARLSLTPATLSASVAALQRRGFLRGEPDAEDRRRVKLIATAEGKSLGKALALWPEQIEEVLAELPQGDRVVLYRTLLRVILFLLEKGVIQEARMCLTCSYFRANRHRDPGRPHHCALVDTPLGLSNLKVNCPDHVRGASPRKIRRQLDRWLAVAE